MKEKCHNSLVEILLRNKDLGVGLYDGRMGLLLCYYRKHNGTMLQPEFDKALEGIINSLPQIEDFSFSQGLLGIGYGLNLLLERGFFSFDNHDVFCYLDDRIYREIASHKSVSLSLFSKNSALAKAFYFYSRIKVHTESNHYRQLANTECLVLLTTEIKELLLIIINHRDELINKRPVTLLELGQCFVLLYRILLHDINKNYCQELLLAIRDLIHDFFEKEVEIGLIDKSCVLRLLYSYVYVAFDIKDKYMKQFAVKWAKVLFPTIVSNNNIDIYMANYISVLCGIGEFYRYNTLELAKSTFSFRKTMEAFLGQGCESEILIDAIA